MINGIVLTSFDDSFTSLNNPQYEEPKLEVPSIEVTFDSDNEIPVCIKSPNSKIVVSDEKDEEPCIVNQCNIEEQYGCPQEFFSIKNLFSELTTDYQRATIRQNLGIGDEQSLVWGKIQGNLANQQDLYKFIKQVAQADSDRILELVNQQLEYWANHIENKMESRASNITSFQLKPQQSSVMDTPVDLLVSWEYSLPVEAQKINGHEIQPTTRNYLFQGLTESTDIKLSYYLNGIWLHRTVTFTIYAPIYYGISANYEECESTYKDKVTVNAEDGQYIHILTPVKSEFSVNGLVGGFVDEGVTYINNRRYFVYRSYNSGLGKTTVTRYDLE